MAVNILDLSGISGTTFQVGLKGPLVKNNSGNFELTNAAGTSDVSLTASVVNHSATSGQIVLNSAATGSGSSWTTTIQSAQTGQTAAWTLTLPSSAGTTGQVLQTDGTGITSWVSTASGAAYDTNVAHVGTYTDASPYSMFTLPANAIIKSVSVNVTTAFNGTSPAISLGVTGTTSKWLPSTDVDLTTVGQYGAIYCQSVATIGSSQAVIITLNPGTGGTAGAYEILVTYTVPNLV